MRGDFVKFFQVLTLMRISQKFFFGKFVRNFFDLFHYKKVKSRRLMLRSFGLNQYDPAKLKEFSSLGFVLLDSRVPKTFQDDVNNVIEFSEKLLHKKYSESSAVRYKHYWKYWSDLIPDVLDENHPLIKVALNRSVIDLVSNYMGTVPCLRYALLTESTHSSDEILYSQKWHFDNDDSKVVKLFIYLSDVSDINDGPFTLLSKVTSNRIKSKFLNRHKEDNEVYKKISNQELVEFYGPKGLAFLCSTRECLHMGSRIKPGHKRLLYTALYTPDPAMFGSTDARIKASKSASNLDRAVLSSS